MQSRRLRLRERVSEKWRVHSFSDAKRPGKDKFQSANDEDFLKIYLKAAKLKRILEFWNLNVKLQTYHEKKCEKNMFFFCGARKKVPTGGSCVAPWHMNTPFDLPFVIMVSCQFVRFCRNMLKTQTGWHCVATLLKLRSAADFPSLASALSEGENSHFQEAFFSWFSSFFSSFLEMAYCRNSMPQLFQLPYGQHHREPAGGLDPTGWDASALGSFPFSVVFVAVSPGVPLFCLSHSTNHARGLRPTLRRHEVMSKFPESSCQAIARDGSFICAQGYVPWPRSLFWGVKRHSF